MRVQGQVPWHWLQPSQAHPVRAKSQRLLELQTEIGNLVRRQVRPIVRGKKKTVVIFMAFLMMGADKIRRPLRLFFVFLSAWFYACKRPASSWMLFVPK
jgi:hypothetical protein